MYLPDIQYRKTLDIFHDVTGRMLIAAAYEVDEAIKTIGVKFNPDQPRVPAGNPSGGQWTDGAGSDESQYLMGSKSQVRFKKHLGKTYQHFF